MNKICKLCNREYINILTHITESHPEIEALTFHIWDELCEMTEEQIKNRLRIIGIGI